MERMIKRSERDGHILYKKFVLIAKQNIGLEKLMVLVAEVLAEI